MTCEASWVWERAADIHLRWREIQKAGPREVDWMRMSHDIAYHDLMISKGWLRSLKGRNNIISCALTGESGSLCTKEVQVAKSGIRSLIKYYLQMISLSLLGRNYFTTWHRSKVSTVRMNGEKSVKVLITALSAAAQVVLKIWSPWSSEILISQGDLRV